MKPDFEKEAVRLLTNAVSQCDRQRDVLRSLRAAYAAGLERAAEIADERYGAMGEDLADAIRAEKEGSHD